MFKKIWQLKVLGFFGVKNLQNHTAHKDMIQHYKWTFSLLSPVFSPHDDIITTMSHHPLKEKTSVVSENKVIADFSQTSI